jgi:hypothetical protein
MGQHVSACNEFLPSPCNFMALLKLNDTGKVRADAILICHGEDATVRRPKKTSGICKTEIPMITIKQYTIQYT